MYKIAVMGDWDSIYGFSALGLDTFRVVPDGYEEAKKTLRRIAGEDYAIVFVTEALAAHIPDEIERLRPQPKPAVILIPGISGNTGEGIAAVRESVIRAVGSDIVFGNK